MKYDIVTVMNSDVHDAVEQLKEEVNERIKIGWKPQGGVSIEIRSFIYERDEVIAFQAMIKEE